MKKIEISNIAKVLIRLPNWVGDIVMATPSILSLIRENPKIEIHLALRKHLCPLVEDFPNVKKIHPIVGKGVGSNFNLLKKIRKENYDAYIIMAKGFREGIIAKFSKIPVTVGFSVNHRKLLFTHPVEMTKGLWETHHAVQFSKLLSPFEIELKNEKIFLPASKTNKNEALRIIEEYQLKEKKFIVFHIGASKFPRAYHSERFGRAAK
ncbi:MAG: hypothetical protein N2445_04170, partial [Acidobacteria bacterium]|nr:hypothetical protein [Acidobacteriota bacterium]